MPYDPSFHGVFFDNVGGGGGQNSFKLFLRGIARPPTNLPQKLVQKTLCSDHLLIC